MACSGAYATAEEFFQFWDYYPRDQAEPVVNQFLKITAGSIHAARNASGGCEGALAEWARDYLQMLNIVMAAVMHVHPACPSLSDDQRRAYMDWATNELALIREGKLELVDGETGTETAYVTWAEQTHTSFNHARRILSDRMRKGL